MADLAKDKSAMPSGYRLIWHEETGSTNDDARAAARAGDTGPLWIAAGRQSAGRGRRGRKWESRQGNLHATLLLQPDCPPEKAGELSFVAALAVLSMAESLLPSSSQKALRLSVKWPNDVLLNGRKVAGCLLESDREHDRALWVAVGVGVNLAYAPQGTPYPATSFLQESGKNYDVMEALFLLAHGFDDLLAVWREEGGFFRILQEWQARASGIGEEIVVRLTEETLRGRFERLDDDGALCLSLASGEMRRIQAGDVFFR